MKRTGPRTWNGTTAPTSIISMGDLQLWVITTPVQADIETLAGVLPVGPGVAPRDLATLGHPLKVDEAVVVDYGADHDAVELVQRMQEFLSQQGKT